MTTENSNKFQMVAKTFQGLEEVLRDELSALGAENVEAGKRMVQFEGDLAMMYKANICCRTALRILKPIVKFTASDTDDLYDAVREIEWEKYMTPDSTFSIDSTVISSEFTHSKFVTYRVKDGIADHFYDICGRRPSIRLHNPDVMLNVHISEDRVTISLDSSGEPLSKRGYKVENTEAPINEVLAAGIILMSGWKGECDFADPMCGSGTFLTEAALIAANINPGIYRDRFAFESWDDFDPELFEEIYNDDSGEREFAYKIYGGDIDPEAVRIARRNVKSAKVDNMVEISCRSIEEWTDNAPQGVLVTNPPYGQRINPTNMTAQALYRTIGTCLKQNFEGWNAWIIGLEEGFMKDIGLKPSVKYPLLNGALECTLNEYVMFSGSYNDFRSEGGVMKHSSGKEDGPKVRRMTDKEWEDDARRFDGKSRKKDFSRHDKPRRFDDEKPRRFSDDKPRRFDGDKPRRFDSDKRRDEPRKISNLGPKLERYEETRAPGKMRSRKNFRQSFGKDDDE